MSNNYFTKKIACQKLKYSRNYKILIIFLRNFFDQLKKKFNIFENNIIGVKVAIVLPYVKTLITIT